MISKRMKWVRESLNLTLSDAAASIGMAKSHLHSLEKSATKNFYTYVAIARCYSRLWSKLEKKPKFEGMSVSQITTEWLMFGENTTYLMVDALYRHHIESLNQREFELIQRNFELENKIKELKNELSRDSKQVS